MRSASRHSSSFVKVAAVKSLKLRVAGLPCDRVVDRRVVQVIEKLHPQNFFHGLRAVCVDQHAVGMGALLFARRAQSSGAEEAVGSKRRERAVVIAVFERGQSRVRRQYVQQQGRASTGPSPRCKWALQRPGPPAAP